MANKLNTSIQLEKDLFDQIYKSMQGDVIQEVIKATRIPSKQNYWKDSLEGHSIKVDEKLLKRFHDLIEEVKSKLGFKEKVDSTSQVTPRSTPSPSWRKRRMKPTSSMSIPH